MKTVNLEDTPNTETNTLVKDMDIEWLTTETNTLVKDMDIEWYTIDFQE